MATNDEQETIDWRQQILEAALKVFGTKGFHKATNKDIAEAAGGISPGLIYWYFKDKQELLLSIIHERATILQLADHPEQLMELPPREALAVVARAYLSMLRSPANIAFFKIMIGEAIRFPQIGEMVYKRAAGRVIGVVSQYLQHQIDLGTLRPHDTMIATRCFLGMIIVHIMAREILRQPEAIATPDDLIVATAVDMFVRGLEAERQDAKVTG
jgi:TetR/AcrR family transcriptional repressor of mexJK operon